MNTPTDTSEARHPIDQEIYLPKIGTWAATWYLLDGKAQDAIALAVASGRPLLVRGLPGTGKSHLARAAAEFLERAFVYEVVTARTEPQDLLWRFDAIARLADAQAKGAGVGPAADAADPAMPLHYVSPGSRWWALDWESAGKHVREDCKTAAQCPDKDLKTVSGNTVSQQQRAQANGTVLLLDEIDKADSELPNSLLEVLANTGFSLPWGDVEITSDAMNKAVPRPLIIITTNEDRELPPAFVRRCLVLNIIPEGDFSEWIKQRARVHFHNPDDKRNDDDARPALTRTVLDQAADYLLQERNTPGAEGPQPGLAEYLDLLRGLQHLAADDETGQMQWLERVYQFSYTKHPVANP